VLAKPLEFLLGRLPQLVVLRAVAIVIETLENGLLKGNLVAKVFYLSELCWI
jgi:hypothetical protein